MARSPEVCVGIDVLQDRLDVHARRLGRPVVVAHDAAGLAALATGSRSARPADRARGERRLERLAAPG